MKIPKKIRIIGKTYDIKIVDPVDIYQNDGNIQYNISEIRVKKSQSRECQEQTFLHEITHAMMDTLGIDMGERDIDCVASVLQQIIPQIED